jgi:hypothetical protein
MFSKISLIITKVSTGVLGVCLIAMFALDYIYYNDPATHVRNSIIGRVYEHPIKSSSPIYLTRQEFGLYEWIYIALIVCGIMLAGAAIIEAVARKVRRSRFGDH